MRAVICWLLVSIGAWSLPVGAQTQEPMSPAVQARWDHLAAELRCLVCQNESLASSSAELAVDLRREVREELTAAVRRVVEPEASACISGTFAVLPFGWQAPCVSIMLSSST